MAHKVWFRKNLDSKNCTEKAHAKDASEAFQTEPYQPTDQLTNSLPPLPSLPRGRYDPRKITDGHPTTIFPTQPNREEANPALDRLERKLLPTCFNLKLSFGFGFARSVSSPGLWQGVGWQGEFVSLSTPVYHLATAGGKTEGKNRWKNVSTLAQLPRRWGKLL